MPQCWVSDRIARLMHAAQDSPGVTVREGNVSMRASRAQLRSAAWYAARERLTGDKS